MTAIAGIVCRDGVVIGADSSTTFAASGGIRTIEQPTQKITIVSNSVIVAGTGQVGFAQRFDHIVDQAYRNKLFQSHQIEIGKTLCAMAIQDLGSTGAKLGQYGALVGFVCGDKARLCEFAVGDFQPEFKDEKIWYCSMGSGQLITDPFLAFIREVFWSEGPPTVQDATFAITWALDHAIAVNPGGVNGPVKVATLQRHGGKWHAATLEEADLEEHRQNIAQAKERLRSFPATQQPEGGDVPDVPAPPPAGIVDR